MDQKKNMVAEGNCIISEEVIATIAATAAVEVEGVAAMAPRSADLRGLVTATAGKSVQVMNNANETVLDVYLMLCASVRIQEVCAEVQKAVKSAVQSMTGKPVTRVNVHVMGMVFDGATEEKK